MELIHLNHSVGQNSFHFVWKLKYAFDSFKFLQLKKDCEAILKETAERYKILIHSLEIMSDHVHLFAELPSTISVSKALNLLKGYSAYRLFRKHPWLRNYFRRGHLWSPGKFFRSVGNVTAEAIKHYIEQTNHGTFSQQSLMRYPAL